MQTTTRIVGLALMLICALAQGQEEAPETPAQKQPAAPAGADGAADLDNAVLSADQQEKIKTLYTPAQVARELQGLKSKADIKAEVKVRVAGTRPALFRGVVRNGKLIEELIAGKGVRRQRFVSRKEYKNSRCGVRLWWSGDSDGYIFFRYSTIESISLTGKLTAEERAEIMRRLKAKKEGKDPDAAAKAALAKAAAAEAELADLSPEELKRVLVLRYPYDEGWNHERKRELKKKQLVENKALSVEEMTFLRYFEILRDAHFEQLKTKKGESTEIEPGTPDEHAEDGKEEEPADD